MTEQLLPGSTIGFPVQHLKVMFCFFKTLLANAAVNHYVDYYSFLPSLAIALRRMATLLQLC